MSAVDDVWSDFRQAVNMSPKALEDWLETDESKDVGQKSSAGSESTGHESGRRIVQIVRTRKADLTDDDAAHMRKVVGYVQRHLAQRPDKSADELEHTRWTASLRNWGHDPLQD
ncbi:MAG: cation transporter [Frankiales bacterium]|nr:cation transporter [Frankiales bacterium]